MKMFIVGLLLLLVVLAFLSLLVSSSGVKYTVAKTVEQDPSLPHFELGGVVLHGEVFGNPANPTVMVLHGGAGWDYKSMLSLKELSDEFFVVFYDQRGSGLSPRVDKDELTFENYLTDLNALIDHFSPGRPVYLIGHSFGGMLATSYVGRYPDKVVGLVLAESGPLTSEMAEYPSFKFPFGVRFAFHAVGTWLESRFYSGPDDQARSDYFAGKFLGSYAGRGHPLAGYFCTEDVTQGDTQHWRLGGEALTYIKRTYPSGADGQRFSFLEGLGAFEKQVLFLTGSCDVILGAELQREQLKFFRDARMVVIDGAGHEMIADNPEASLAAIREYLSEQNR